MVFRVAGPGVLGTMFEFPSAAEQTPAGSLADVRDIGAFRFWVS